MFERSLDLANTNREFGVAETPCECGIQRGENGPKGAKVGVCPRGQKGRLTARGTSLQKPRRHERRMMGGAPEHAAPVSVVGFIFLRGLAPKSHLLRKMSLDDAVYHVVFTE